MSDADKSDVDEIAQALYRYARALDRKDWALLDSVFASEIVTDWGIGAPVEGRAAVVANIRRNLDHLRAQHLFGNMTVTVRGDDADSVAAVRAMHVGTVDGKHATLEAIGEYFCAWKRLPEGWRATHIRLAVTANIGDRRVLSAHFADRGATSRPDP